MTFPLKVQPSLWMPHNHGQPMVACRSLEEERQIKPDLNYQISSSSGNEACMHRLSVSCLFTDAKASKILCTGSYTEYVTCHN